MGGVVGNVDALREEILRRAKEQAAEIIERAERVAKRDMAYAKKEVREIAQQHKARVQPMAEMEKRKTLVTAQMQSRRNLLEKKDQLVSSIFSEAEKKLEEMRGSREYSDLMLRLLTDGINSIDGDVVIEYGDKDKDFFTSQNISSIKSIAKESLDKKSDLEFRNVGDSISAGVIIKSANGRIVIDNSFTELLRRLKDEIRGKVSEILLQE
ncbi:hypothetical protein GF312_08300 [Candidatus Poribacteria bacterium]|nr:hypothetical protein [Candidatus Poribacteria bacterium]